VLHPAGRVENTRLNLIQSDLSTAAKSTQKRPPITASPAGNLSFQLCQRVGQTRTNFDGLEIEQPFCGWLEGQNTRKYFVIPLADLNSPSMANCRYQN
jgi:hypothetical protein